MRLGIDQISTVIQKKLKGKRIGLLCHPASVNSRLQHILTILRSHPNLFVRTLFGPEHGIWGVAQDMESVEGIKDSVTDLPIHSLYGSTLESLRPNGKMLEKLEAVVCDLQDVGSRYYTFAYTLAFMMQACRNAGIQIFVLDRPNPINGTDVEGGTIENEV